MTPPTTTCPMCDAHALEESTVEYTAPIKYANEIHEITAVVPAIVCAACGARFFDHVADRILRTQLRDEHGLLQPGAIRALRDRYGLTQREVAEGTGIADATISRIEQFHVLHSRKNDKLLKYFFAEQERLHRASHYELNDDASDAAPVRETIEDAVAPCLAVEPPRAPAVPNTAPTANAQFALAA